MATGPENYRAAERLVDQSRTWENADTGWKAHLSGEERLARRMADLTEALVLAQLADAAATALNDNDPNGEGMPGEDYREWKAAASVKG
ncbi:hypothetical protein [Streptomyces sp. NRRL S-455]|uniref:hypothetical protein n=1 Tax=Streptomyces sp. NRRL S-455 TaxID=1463908 RepID=UPI0004BECDCE|nr:hypothetical protein [Streptomyces sp. NRRL S-455]